MDKKTENHVRRCTRCIMDDRSDPFIRFDEKGVCNYCTSAYLRASSIYHPDDEVGRQMLEKLIRRLKEEGKGKKYDCLMGISGGLDSCYLAYLGAHKWGLRIAGVHIDDGYDTEVCKNNYTRLCETAGIDLYTITPDAEQYNALTLAYMKAGVPNLAVPQDNVLTGFLYKFARDNNIKYFLSGFNFSTENILQEGNTWSLSDLTNLKDIHRRFGDKPIDKLEFISTIDKMTQKHRMGIETFTPLNWVPYTREAAFKELGEYCGFQYYGRKHLENYLTAFIQLCWFPEKFNVDKRTSHLSSLIVTGQMTREEALKELAEPMYDQQYMELVKDLLCKNMGLTREELDKLIKAPGHQHSEYKTEKLYPCLKKIYRMTIKKPLQYVKKKRMKV